jgi:hypothetical protein
LSLSSASIFTLTRDIPNILPALLIFFYIQTIEIIIFC